MSILKRNAWSNDHSLNDKCALMFTNSGLIYIKVYNETIWVVSCILMSIFKDMGGLMYIYETI